MYVSGGYRDSSVSKAFVSQVQIPGTPIRKQVKLAYVVIPVTEKREAEAGDSNKLASQLT